MILFIFSVSVLYHCFLLQWPNLPVGINKVSQWLFLIWCSWSCHIPRICDCMSSRKASCLHVLRNTSAIVWHFHTGSNINVGIGEVWELSGRDHQQEEGQRLWWCETQVVPSEICSYRSGINIQTINTIMNNSYTWYLQKKMSLLSNITSIPGTALMVLLRTPNQGSTKVTRPSRSVVWRSVCVVVLCNFVSAPLVCGFDRSGAIIFQKVDLCYSESICREYLRRLLPFIFHSSFQQDLDKSKLWSHS